MVFFFALICAISRRIPARASSNQEDEKGDSIQANVNVHLKPTSTRTLQAQPKVARIKAGEGFEDFFDEEAARDSHNKRKNMVPTINSKS